MSEPREALATALSGFLTAEQMETLVNDVLAITKKGRAEFLCKHCGKRQVQFAEVSDAKAVALALPDLLNQAYGRPVESSVLAEPIKFYRLTNLADVPETPQEPQEPRPAPVGRGRQRTTPMPADGLTAA